MANDLSRNDVMLNRTIRAISGESTPSLALQHLDYTVMLDHHRAIMTEHAMHNTQLLMGYAVQIMEENPETAGALKEIMRAYVDTATGTIRSYGNPSRR